MAHNVLPSTYSDQPSKFLPHEFDFDCWTVWRANIKVFEDITWGLKYLKISYKQIFMFQLHEDIWWANAQLWNDWGYLMSQYSYSSLKRLTIFVGTCLESLNLGGEGRDQTISKDCSPHLSFVLF